MGSINTIPVQKPPMVSLFLPVLAAPAPVKFGPFVSVAIMPLVCSSLSPSPLFVPRFSLGVC